LKGTEKVMDSRLAGVQPFVIRVRYDKETACIENDWRAVDARDERVIYAIKTAEDMNRRREFIDIICETGTAA
jgi:head-tail adaptor